jgi:hypothetical protein
MPARKTNWILIVVAVLGFIVIVGVGVVGLVGFMVYRQSSLQYDAATPESAEKELEKIRARFAGQKPFIEVTGEHGEIEPRVIERGDAHPQHIDSLHLMAWDPGEEQLVRITMPFWILRLSGNRPIRFSSGDDALFRARTLKVTASDIERHGPGLILDHREPGGHHVLIWAQ